VTAYSWSATRVVTITSMTFDKQSHGRRTTVESKSNRSCNNRLKRKFVGLGHYWQL